MPDLAKLLVLTVPDPEMQKAAERVGLAGYAWKFPGGAVGLFVCPEPSGPFFDIAFAVDRGEDFTDDWA